MGLAPAVVNTDKEAEQQKLTQTHRTQRQSFDTVVAQWKDCVIFTWGYKVACFNPLCSKYILGHTELEQATF